jgi:GINS complex subunit 4
MLDLLRSDPKTSEEEHFKLMLVQTEMERVKFLIRAYVRCRMAKVSRRPREAVLAVEIAYGR